MGQTEFWSQIWTSASHRLRVIQYLQSFSSKENPSHEVRHQRSGRIWKRASNKIAKSTKIETYPVGEWALGCRIFPGVSFWSPSWCIRVFVVYAAETVFRKFAIMTTPSRPDFQRWSLFHQLPVTENPTLTGATPKNPLACRDIISAWQSLAWKQKFHTVENFGMERNGILVSICKEWFWQRFVFLLSYKATNTTDF